MHPMPSHFTVWPTLPYEKIKKKKCQKCQTKKEEEESRIKYNLLMSFQMIDFTATTTTTSLI